MLSEEEKKAIAIFKSYINAIETFGTIDYKCINNLYEPAITVLNLIEKLKKENKDIKKRKDSQEKRFKKYKENIEKKHEEIYENLVSENEEKDKQIDLMAEFISKQDVEEEICIKNKTNPDWCNEDYTNCKDCIKQYFERKSK